MDDAQVLFGATIKKAIVEYILLDPDERERIRIRQVPRSYPKFTIRAPIPWHANILICRESIRHALFITHPVVLEIQRIWNSM